MLHKSACKCSHNQTTEQRVRARIQGQVCFDGPEPHASTWQVLSKLDVLCRLGTEAADNMFKYKYLIWKGEYII